MSLPPGSSVTYTITVHNTGESPYVGAAATDTLTPPTDGTAKDTATSGDSAGISCGAATCKTGEVCCVTPKEGGADQACAASCADGGVTIGCDGPEDCPTGAANICCAALKAGAGTPPACPLESASAACAASCPTRIPSSCPGAYGA